MKSTNAAAGHGKSVPEDGGPVLSLNAAQRYTVTPLSLAAERELGWAIVNDNCHDSREKMILANLHLVSDVACRYAGRGVSLGELVQRGKTGLIRAVEHYDPAQGMRFSTPARWWIKQAIRQALRSPMPRPLACRRTGESSTLAPGEPPAGATRSDSKSGRGARRAARADSPALET